MRVGEGWVGFCPGWEWRVSCSSYQLLRRASTKFIHCRTGPRESSFAPNFFLPVDDVDSSGLPWLDYGGPPGTSWGLRVNCKAAGHAGSTQQEVERASFPKFRHGNG